MNWLQTSTPAQADVHKVEPPPGWFYWYWHELGNEEDLDYMWEWPECWLGKSGHA